MFYRSVRLVFRVLAAPMFRFRVRGAERFPARGPGVVVAPHRSWLDPACVGAACPRPISFLMASDMYHKPWIRWFYRQMRALPVERGGGGESTASLRGALRRLREGELIGVFPEGRVLPEGDLGPVQRGAAMLAVRVRAPVIPMVIRGSSRAWPHGRAWPGPARVSVEIGEPIAPPDPAAEDAVGELLRRIECALSELARNGSGPCRP